jgi:hypothetical protein
MHDNKDRLAELCSRALSETDPDELLALFGEINDILWTHVLHVREVIERHRELEESLYRLPSIM